MNASASPVQPRESVPTEVRCAQDYETLASRFIAAPTLAYIMGGAGRDETAAANIAAFRDHAILPRMLREVTAGHTRCQPGPETFEHPFLLAPVAHQKLVHPAAELATARAAAATDSGMICSTLSSARLEDIAALAGPRRWFQLYFQASRSATLDLVRRAEGAGYSAIVVTVDAPIQVASLRALQAGFRWPAECAAANLQAESAAPDAAAAPQVGRIFGDAMRSAPTSRDLDWLISECRVPLWVKGVLHPDDARGLREQGAAGVVVSNHGGRALDGAPASLRMLPAVRAAVGTFPLLFDGGIRSGADAFKALALGADAVLIGRLQLYALAAAGALGVAHMLKLLREELEICMSLGGCATLGDIRRESLVPAGAPPC